jgi:hypothetical protein
MLTTLSRISYRNLKGAPLSNPSIPKLLGSMAKLMPGGERIDADTANFLNDRLSAYPSDKVYTALDRCFKELKFFPTFSDIIERIDDGRPGTEEAWALCPKDDHSAAYVTNEIMSAWSAVSSLMKERGGEMAARMAFKESYEREVKRNRAGNQTPHWFLSRACGPGSVRVNEAALRLAVEKGRVIETQALQILPEYTPTGKTGIGHDDAIKNLISQTMKGIE